MAKKATAEKQPENSDRCENCGACKHCGAGGKQFVPYPYPVYPQPYPYRPWWGVNPQPYWQPQVIYSSGTSISATSGLNPYKNTDGGIQ